MAFVPSTSSRVNNTGVDAISIVVPMLRQFPDVSKIEQFDGKNFRHWQEHVYIILDIMELLMHLHSLHLSWMLTKPRRMLGPMLTRHQAPNERVLLEELWAQKINMSDEFMAGVLIEKLPNSWNENKQQLKHK
ncbi:hypothetical protein K1719_011017 [Acacia pycnantha]|nr:hypothetical protein K1719_011017 [Acacia pycnantha]